MATGDPMSTRREPSLRLGEGGFASRHSGDWHEPEPEPRDWKKVFLVIGLGALSWVATYVGMLELIQSNMGDLPLVHKVIIGFSVAMLMTMIIWLLDQIFSPIPLTTKVVYVFGYVFLTLISVGFGFGFYWKVLESRGEATRSAESAISQVQTALHAGSTRLDQLSETLSQLTTVSTAKAVEEREKGTSCPYSSPGDGPRRKLRDADAQKFSFAGEFVKGRAASIKAELAGLDAELIKVANADGSTVDPNSGTRNEFMRALNRRLDLTVTGFNAFRSDPQLGQIRSDLAERAEKTVFPNGKGGTFVCPDPQLQAALRGVVRAIDQLPVMQKPQVAAVEGAEATIEAFRRLAATVQGALVFELPPSADELRALQKKAVQSVSNGATAPAPVLAQPVGLSKRDYIPLTIALFVDFCLLLVSIGRPINRLNGLVPVMREAERGPMIKILSRFNEIHRDPDIRQNFEVFRHVVFDMHGAYYVAVPLDAPYRPNGRGGQAGFGYGSSDAQELQHEAHLLANLFSGFEQQRIFSRVYNPFLTTKAIQKKLWRQGSKFAGCQAFRVYRFRDGAWSDMILQAVMGAARRAEEDHRVRMQAEAEARAANPQPTPQETTVGHANVEQTDPLRGFDTGLRHAPDVERPATAPGFSHVHPGVMNSREAKRQDGIEASFADSQTGAAKPKRKPKSSTGYYVNGTAERTRRRRAARAEETPTPVAPAARSVKPTAPASAADTAAMRQAFGKYAGVAAAEFSHQLDGDDWVDGDDNAALPSHANGNTAPSHKSNDRGEKNNTLPKLAVETDADDHVVLQLDAKRQGRVDRSEAQTAEKAPAQLTPKVPAKDDETIVSEAATVSSFESNGMEQGPASEAASSNKTPSNTTHVTLTRETATFTMPAEAQVSDVIPLRAAVPVDAAIEAPAAAPKPITPPPLPAWSQQKPQADVIDEVADVEASVEMVAEPVEEKSSTTGAETGDGRWQLTADPFGFDDDEDDTTIVTIAQRLRPDAENS
ncbi:MAG: hypothetical protein RIC14_01040 [Filomicrobium sp.]